MLSDSRESADPGKVLKRVFEQEGRRLGNIKSAREFDLTAQPRRMYLRSEFEELSRLAARYVITGIPTHVVIHGSRGSGKTVTVSSLASELEASLGGVFTYYVNLREERGLIGVYERITGERGRGFGRGELNRRLAGRLASGRSLVVLDEADFLYDEALLYLLARETRSMVLLITQNAHFMDRLSPSVLSSLQPVAVHFPNYDAEQLYQILKLRAEDGLNHYDEGGIRHIAALTVSEHGADARIAIRALYHVGVADAWGPGDVRLALTQAARDVEGLILTNLPLRDLAILIVSIEAHDTIQAYRDAVELLAKTGDTVSKPTYFRTLTHLQNLGLVVLVKKKATRAYTIEVQSLLKNPEAARAELQRRLTEAA
ncbi:hypothetical protein B9Q03_14440 [Candidatus Marsarchaeota G2 archaeon OSP_D]|jgi:Cdc6-related protein, AAA superfamily ATPase|uniref:AAA+ ATPase domain-containing protein n=1 Tax=Candidatus Marsarchaeota G2 archaeon OSP_D TaxID=1978157 RepID=A0A2R6A769_9ARCH|nr:MAG: hypothetical protein B9Q03_14440 [Candidatus Marsarchaeota G2 archaeon OSP_D]